MTGRHPKPRSRPSGITRTAPALLAGIALAALGACGQKGPLVLPDEAATRARTAPAPGRADDGARADTRSADSGGRTTDDDDDGTKDGADGG